MGKHYPVLFPPCMFIIVFLTAINSHADTSANISLTTSKSTFYVSTYDGLKLPAQIIIPTQIPKKMVLFINGATPYDEKGNLGAFWTDEGKVIPEKHKLYLRLIEILPAKGYSLVTMAKRSFVYPQKIPRPSLDELALDIVSLVNELKNKGLLHNESDLVIVGYSEGSIVATKVLGLLKNQPRACILLGSASLAFNFNTQSWNEWFMTDIIRKTKQWTDEQIKTEYEQWSEINLKLLTIDETIFENELKKNNPHGFGFAQWESYHIDKELQFYDPIPNILTSNIPILICIGENDTAMPKVLAQRTYDQLIENGFQKAMFKVIENESHSYNKYDVFALIDTWITSEGESIDITFDDVDNHFINKYAQTDEISNSISALSWERREPEKTLETYWRAKEIQFEDSHSWFKLGIKLFDNELYDESLDSFNQALDPDYMLKYGSMVWIGHIYDLLNRREDAVSYYKKALDNYPGFPIQHDQWGVVIDKQWIKARLDVPFKRSMVGSM